MRAAEFLEIHPAAWQRATRHPFLDAVREGTLPAGAFEAWLAQDYLFVNDLLAFQSQLLARTPKRNEAVVGGGLVGLEAELSWFEEQAAERKLDLHTPRHQTTREYREFLARLALEPYAAGITALWAMERAYLEAWSSAAPGHRDHRPFVEHWTTPDFAGYVAGLESAADTALTNGDEGGRAERAFLEVARLEEEFWQIAFSANERSSG